MIIYIDRSIGEIGKEKGLNNDERVLFEQLVLSHKKGICLLCGERTSIEWLAVFMGGWCGEIYKRICEESPQIKAIVNAVETLLVLSHTDEPTLPGFIQEKCRVLIVQDATKYNLFLPCSLVGENLNDCAFYKLVAERYCCLQNIKGIDLKFRDELGGGDTMATVFEKCVVIDKVLTLCLMDSDIKYGPTKEFPQMPQAGETAGKLLGKYQKLVETHNAATFDFYCIEAHEIENLIPMAVLERVAVTTPDMINGVNYLKKFIDAKLEDAILLYDFKEGGQKIKSGAPSAYWQMVTSSIADDSMPCLCKKVMEKALEVMKEEVQVGVKYVTVVPLESYLISRWEAIGRKAFSWGCAHMPVRS